MLMGFYRGGSVGTQRGVFKGILKEVPGALKDVSLVLEKVSVALHEKVPQENLEQFLSKVPLASKKFQVFSVKRFFRRGSVGN